MPLAHAPSPHLAGPAVVYATPMVREGLAGAPMQTGGYARFRDELDGEERGEAASKERVGGKRRCCDGERICDLLTMFVVGGLLMVVVLGLTAG